MWKDPIVSETRELREQYAKQFNHDVDAIFEDIQLRQKTQGRNLVSFPPRKPTLAVSVAQQGVAGDALQAASRLSACP